MTDMLFNQVRGQLEQAGNEIAKTATLPAVGAELLPDSLTMKIFQMEGPRKKNFCTVNVVIDKTKNQIWQIQVSKLVGAFAPMRPVVIKILGNTFRGITIGEV